MDWLVLKHALLSHLPAAVGLLLPWALVAAQRPGRGIRPWWTVCRYLGWMGLAGLLVSAVSGLASLSRLGLPPVNRLALRATWQTGPDSLLLRHLLLGVLSLLLAAAAIWAMNRPRKDHQSLGLLALLAGLAWSAALVLAGDFGHTLAHGRPRSVAPIVTLVPALATEPPLVPDARTTPPLRVLDYAALEPLHPDPVKSPAHGGRWIRAWASPEAAAAYREGQALPPGSLVVLSSQEDRWGRPGPDVGPLYALEVSPSGPSLLFYWPSIPRERRSEFAGQSRVLWRDHDAPQMEACQACHAKGMADRAARSRWRPARRTD